MSSSAVGRSTLTAGDQPVPVDPGTGWYGCAPMGALGEERQVRAPPRCWNGPVQGPGTSVRVPGARGPFRYWVTYSVM
jgi:hypothetical protein